MSDPRPKVKVCGYVPEDLKEAWDNSFGDYGSYSWLLESAMREMLVVARNHPTREALIRQAIQAHISNIAIERQQSTQSPR